MISILLTVLLTQDLPQHGEGPINDFAGEIDKGTYAKIEKAIADLKGKDVRLVVATVTSLQGLSVEDYAIKLTKKWGVGEKGKNNGILLLHAPKERKIRIENGYGVESRLTDIESKGVINRMVPLMKDGKYAAAILQAVEDIGRILSEKPAPAEEPEKQNASTGPPPSSRSGGEAGIYIIIGMLVVVLGAIIIIIWLQSRPIRLDPPTPRKSSVFDAGLPSPTPSESHWPPTSMPYVPPIYSPPRRRRDDDDDSSSRRSSSSDWGSSSSSSYDSGSSSSSSDSGSYGGGDSGGGGASGDY